MQGWEGGLCTEGFAVWVGLCLKKEPFEIQIWLQKRRNKTAVGAAFVSGYKERLLLSV